MFIGALFKQPKSRTQSKRPSTHKCVIKMQNVHKREYYSTIKRNEFESVKSEVDEPRPCEGSQQNKQHVLHQKLTLHCKAIILQLKINLKIKNDHCRIVPHNQETIIFKISLHEECVVSSYNVATHTNGNEQTTTIHSCFGASLVGSW